MGTPRFRPASIFAKPRSFGRNVQARFVKTPDLTPGERCWAIYQHRVALKVFRALERRRGGLNGFAQVMGVTPRWMLRQLFGRAPADLGAMLGWMMALEIEPPSIAEVWKMVMAEEMKLATEEVAPIAADGETSETSAPKLRMGTIPGEQAIRQSADLRSIGTPRDARNG